MRNLPTAKLAALAASASGIAVLALASPAAASGCDVVGSPGGSSTGAGTVESPLRSAQQVIDSLESGQIGCLRAGSYGSRGEEVRFERPSLTLMSYPGERAEVHGRVYVTQEAPATVIADLDLDGRNDSGLPSPTVNADDVVLRGNDITNYHTDICVSLGSPHTWGRADRTLIENNRIHDCGRMPATNQDHGIYVNSADDTVIRNNWIYDNADRGIQLYSDSQGTLVTGNVIDGNGEGVIFGGDADSASSNNIVENNVITNSKIRDNLDSWWEDRVGTGNVARHNCVGGGAYDDGDGGIKEDWDGRRGFRPVDNLLITDAGYVDASAGDFTLKPSSPCAGIISGATVPPPTGSAPTGTAPTGSAPTGDTPDKPTGSKRPKRGRLTIRASKRRVHKHSTFKVTGKAASSERVQIVQRRNGHWRPLARTSADGSSYVTRVRARGKHRIVIKAMAPNARASRSVAVRVKS